LVELSLIIQLFLRIGKEKSLSTGTLILATDEHGKITDEHGKIQQFNNKAK